jgi:hypothetical protein
LIPQQKPRFKFATWDARCARRVLVVKDAAGDSAWGPRRQEEGVSDALVVVVIPTDVSVFVGKELLT